MTVCFVCLYLKKILEMQGDVCFMKILYFNCKVNEKWDRNNMVWLEYVFLNMFESWKTNTKEVSKSLIKLNMSLFRMLECLNLWRATKVFIWWKIYTGYSFLKTLIMKQFYLNRWTILSKIYIVESFVL